MFNWKLCGFLVVALLVLCTKQQKNDPAFMETFTKYEVECAKEVGLEESYAKSIFDLPHFPNDMKVKCYFKCVNIKLGVLTEAGEVVDEQLKKVGDQFFDDSLDKEIVAECGGIQGADLCETGYKLMGCIKSAELD